MGLKNGSSENVGLPELIAVLGEFERENSVEVVLSARMVMANGRRDLEWKAMAFDAKAKSGEAKLLAYAKRRCMESRLVLMEALLLQLLYTLDFELGLLEFQSKEETA